MKGFAFAGNAAPPPPTCYNVMTAFVTDIQFNFVQDYPRKIALGPKE